MASNGERREGHVFVVRGDLRNFACSAWMLTTDRRLRPNGKWLRMIPDAEERIDPLHRADFEAERTFSIPVRPRVGEAEPIAYLTAVPLYGVASVDEYRPRIRAFVEAATAMGHSTPLPGRSRLLLAIPPIGTGRGGAAHKKGDVIRMVLDEGRLLANQYGVDIALVMGDNDKSYALAQHLRKTQSVDPWPELAERELVEARRLGRLARSGRLVPFMGAGVSVSAGAPTWSGLIAQLAELARLEPDLRASLLDTSRDALDQASFLRQVFASRYPDDPQAFAAAISRLTTLSRYGLAPALLAALDIEQAITLNYDTLFERAAADGGRPRRTIPSVQPEREVHDRWLLKLHGTADAPETIVLTRSDYLGYNTDRAALSSIVKATLMTRHVLFVGFGMTDDHFHEIMHDVRRAIASTGSSVEGIGTVLTLQEDPLNRELHSELTFIALAERGAPIDVVASARRLEIFLDALLGHASDSHSYLLDTTYGSALTGGERALRQQLERLICETPTEAKVTTSWRVVERMLRDLGGAPEDQLESDREGRVDSAQGRSFTPDRIRALAPHEVFVFGSNAHGRHAGGAARAALKFGAEWGEGNGLHGQSYAIDTMSGFDVIAIRTAEFLEFAAAHPALTFLVSAIGCGTAGYKPNQIAPLFESRPDNVVLPAVFVRVLDR